MTTIRTELRDAVAAARDRAVAAGQLPLGDADPPAIIISEPARPEHGDYATNIAMQLAPIVRKAPMQIAETLKDNLTLPPGAGEVVVERPAFLNFRLDPAWVGSQVSSIRGAGAQFGRSEIGRGQRINVEYISANPTGPLHIGNARGGFIGDVLASVLKATGHRVTREYYINDYGSQVRDFGESVYLARTGQSGEAGYKGEYIERIAAEVPDEVVAAVNPLPAIGAWAWNRVFADIKATLARLGMRFDVYKSERELHDAGEVADAIERLRAAGHVYEADGAIWFRATAFGDDKDRVLIRSHGAPTYFAADVAYLLDKFDRGFDHLIYVLGPDHHGDMARLKGATAALGYDPDRMEIIIYQHVRLAGGAKMSKRAGTFVTLDELISEVGPDATRFFFVMRSASQHLDFDLELAKSQSSENPVYYVQYAHARCCSILRLAADRGVAVSDADTAALLRHPAEQALLRRLIALPDAIADAAEHRAIHELPRYSMEVASLFSQFYRDCHVLSEDPADAALSSARLALVDATRQVLANALGLLGISAPESM
ncbi:MAG: arginine--tRNA ligase [Chloroflexota bacterium]|nr:arginine--tRNA ligase [Chloroflexota bacterium]